MRTIEQTLQALQKSAQNVKLKSGETMTVEIWTPDGNLVGDVGKGVKLTIPLHTSSSETNRNKV